MTQMRIWLLAIAVAALAAACGGPVTPYNPRQACDAVGGILTADGRCRAGNS